MLWSVVEMERPVKMSDEKVRRTVMPPEESDAVKAEAETPGSNSMMNLLDSTGGAVELLLP